jgi:hypothetical protein
MLIKNMSVKLKRSRLDLITSTGGIKIVLYKGVKKGSCLRTQQRDQKEKDVPTVQRLSNNVLIKKIELRLMF